MYTFQWPVRTHVGVGIIRQIGALVPPVPGRIRVLIASAPDVWCQPLLEQVKETLLSAGYQVVQLFAEVEPNPSWETIKRGASICQSQNLDTIIAIGGGSAMDAAKVMAMEGGVGFVVAVPTTAGTGSELNEWGVITNIQTRTKESVQAVKPAVAILDPELTLTVPPLVTLLTGIDAFCHALECYVGTLANPMTDALALMAMEMCAHWLPIAVEDRSKLEARTAMLEASMLAGGAMLGAGLGLMQGIGNIAGGLTHAPHGLVLARLLGPVMAFNEPAIADEKLCRVEPFVGAMRELAREKSAQLKAPQVRMEEHDLPLLAELASVNVNSTTNPRPYTRDDIMAIARLSFHVVHGTAAEPEKR